MQDNKKIKIDNMNCPNCRKVILKNLMSLKGINSVNINLSVQTVILTYNTETVTWKKIKDAIMKQGYNIIEEI